VVTFLTAKWYTFTLPKTALLGFFQEYRAEQAMAALKRLAVPLVRVRRDGNLYELSAKELVPGDVILLEAGNAVPADLRLIESINLRIQEAALTGESEPVEKHAEPLLQADTQCATFKRSLNHPNVEVVGPVAG
jgi:P-type Ca2+ transporter type 2C